MGREHALTTPFTVLVVEDEFLIAMEVIELLEEAGYEVVGPAATVETALALLERHCLHACVLDINLRGTLSTPVAGALKAQKVPFLLSSAYDQATLDQYGDFDGAANIGKPASRERLLATLDALVAAE